MRASSTSKAFQHVYEDEDVVVVDKAAGYLTVPTDKRERVTVVDELSRYLSRSVRITKRACIVHRLDKETSGLLVFAKSERARDVLVAQWSTHKRIYWAVVLGHFPQPTATLRSRLATTKDGRRRSLSDREQGGEEAVTHVRCVKTWVDRQQRLSLLEVELDTGKRNQIRVHLAEAGHPIVGDTRYGHRDAPSSLPMCLHAARLEFLQPRTQSPLTFAALAPPAWNRIVDTSALLGPT
jgi:23S rRNA pseudouridine1911/1915/1917 synthase